jgi:U3 small nucleolar RNA-associated protein 23
MVLEPPSDTTVKTKEAVEEQALHPTPSDLALVPTTTAELPRKKKGPKGPNPMSVKKKKKHIDVPAVNVKGEKDKHVASGSQKPYSEVNERTELVRRENDTKKTSIYVTERTLPRILGEKESDVERPPERNEFQHQCRY